MEQEEEHDIRADLEAALDASAPEPAPEGEGLVASEPEAAPTTAAEERARDALGRFSPQDGQNPPADAAAAAREQQVAEQSQANQQAMRAPGAWRPDAREAWAQIPPAAQAEIARREADQVRLAQESAGARQFSEQMSRTISPYMPMIQADGGNPFTAVQNLFQTAATLRTGTPADKARLVAEIVGSYGVDVAMLDTALAGIPVQSPAADPGVLSEVQRLLDQRLAPVQQLISAAQQRASHQEQQVRTQTRSEIEQFAADPKNDFFSDVREIMADLVEVASRNGRELSLQDAYRQACQLHPDVSKVMLARSTSSSAQRLTAAAQRARAAAVSVSGAPGPAGEATPADDSIRAHIEAAMAAGSR